MADFDLAAWAARFERSPLPLGPDDLVHLGDPETSVAIARRGSLFVVERVNRGVRTVSASFADEEDARRFVVARLGIGWRVGTLLPRFPPDVIAPGVVLEEGPTAQHLSWPGGSAEFPRGSGGRLAAQDFSWVVGATLDEIADSMLADDARPLADRGQV